MLTLALQCLSSVLVVVFAAVALSIARRPLAPDHRAGWLLAGSGFLLLGLTAVAQNAGAVAAFAQGPGTRTWDTYLRWASVLNHSRMTAGIALAAAVGWVAWAGCFPGRRTWARLAAGIAAALLAGAWLGELEGPLDMRTHGFTAAMGFTVELIAFATALLVAAARGTLDVFLFAALVFYAAQVALSVPILSAMSLVTPVTTGGPPPWLIQLQPVVFGSMMLAPAVLRLSLLRQGLRAREAFGREPGARPRLVETFDPPDSAAPTLEPAPGERRRRSRRRPGVRGGRPARGDGPASRE